MRLRRPLAAVVATTTATLITIGAFSGTAGADIVSLGTGTLDGTSAPWASNPGVDEQTGASAIGTATVAGSSGTPTGMVTYTLFQGSGCSGTQIGSPDVETINGDGTVPNSTAFASLAGGTYSFNVAYSGDGTYTGQSTCGQDFTVAPAPLSIQTGTTDGSGRTGASANGTATLSTPVAGFTPTGTVTYDFFSGTANCDTSPAIQPAQALNADGSVPNSASAGPLAAGTYSFEATYSSGDANYVASGSPSCASFVIAPNTVTVTPGTLDATNAAWGSNPGTNEQTGSSAFGTATVAGTTITPTGTVTYRLFQGSGCSGNQVGSSDIQTLENDGSVPNSSAFASLAGGTYAFQADYSGDANYSSHSTCGPGFTVTPAPLSVHTGSADGSGHTGATANGTATLSTLVAGFTPTGAVTYDFFSGTANCDTSPAIQPPQALNPDGSVPNSASTGPLAAGTYSFEATYSSGDANYVASGPASCASLTILPTALTPTNHIVDGTAQTGVSAKDTATLSPEDGTIKPSGTVTYKLFDNGTCTGAPLQSDVQTIALDGSVPSSSSPALNAGTYAYQTVFTSGDGNYTAASPSSCDPFAIGAAPPTQPAVTNIPVSPVFGGGFVADVGTNGDGTKSVISSSLGVCTVAGDGLTVSFVGVGNCALTAHVAAGINYSSADGNTQQFAVGQATPASPSITNIPGSPVFGSGFTASVATNGDGVKSVASNTPGTCTVSAQDNLTVSFVGAGTCTLTAHVGNGVDFLAANGSPQSFNVGRAAPTTPVVTNIPANAVAEFSFTASISTNGDGVRFVVSNTPGICTVGGDGRTVTYVTVGTCTLVAQVGTGTNYGSASGGAQSFGIAPQPRGYWLVGTDGGIFSFGAAAFHGSMGGIPLQRPVVGITPTADRNGYWLVATDGGIFAFGDSTFYGSIPGLGLHPAGSRLPNSLNAPIVGMVPSSSGHGYFMVASDGGVFAFGDANFAGSCPGIGGCVGAAVAVMPDHSGNGYWLVTSVGDVYAFGDAPALGSQPPGGSPAVSAVATPDGQGYWIVDANGAVWGFGDAVAMGQPIGYVNVFNSATAIFSTSDGRGYWVAAARGDVFSYGNAPFLGSMAASGLNGLIIAGYGF